MAKILTAPLLALVLLLTLTVGVEAKQRTEPDAPPTFTFYLPDGVTVEQMESDLSGLCQWYGHDEAVLVPLSEPLSFAPDRHSRLGARLWWDHLDYFMPAYALYCTST